MTNGTRLQVTPPVVVGVGFVLFGTALLLDQLGLVEIARSIRYWPILLVLFGLSLVTQVFSSGDAPAERPRNHHAGGLIWLIVLGFVFSGAASRHRTERVDPSDRTSLFAVMGSDERASVATEFRGGEMTSIMGGTDLDLRHATIPAGGEAVLTVVAVMGGAVVRVPRDWAVDVQVTPFLGGVKDERGRASMADSQTDAPQAGTSRPHLVLRGSVVMGGLVIKS